MNSESRLPEGSTLVERSLSAALFLLGAFVWWSTAITNMAFLAVLMVALARTRADRWRRVFAQPVAVAGLALFAYILLRSVPHGLASVASASRSYFELLILPVLLLALHSQPLNRSLWSGLVAGCVAYGLAHWIGIVHEPLGAYLAGKRISAGFNMALFAYVLFDLASKGVARRASYALSTFAACTVLFAIDSRTGHVVLLVLMMLAAYQAAPRRNRLVASLLALVSFALIAAMSNPVRSRLSETLALATADPRPISAGATSSEIRLAIVKHSMTVTREHFALGTGWSSYGDAFEAAIREAGDAVEVFTPSNPHNEYLLQLGAGGIPALVLFLAWLLAPTVRPHAGGWRWSDRRLRTTAAAFAVGCAFNSLLLDFVEAHFYVTLLAWMVTAHLAATPDRTKTDAALA